MDTHRKILAGLLLLLTAACTGTAAQVAPAIATAQLLEEAFNAEQENVRAFVASGNPPAAQMAQFVAAQSEVRAQFLEIFHTHVSHLQSMGTVDVEATDALLARVTETIEELRK